MSTHGERRRVAIRIALDEGADAADIEERGGGHWALVMQYRGTIRRVFMSKSPSDTARAAANLRRDVRKVMNELKGEPS
jgi:hypothetical protein